jgi:hypothetical protein
VTSKNGVNPYKAAEAELARPDATVESRRDMIEKLRNYLAAKGAKV